jgi:hypothetical protein
MKKQLLIAAVAATMGTAAMADISITGGAKVNYLWAETNSASSTNALNHDVDLTVVGKNGDTAVSMTVATTASSTTSSDTTQGLNVENTFLTTKIGDVSIKAGTWMSGDDMMQASGRSEGKFEAKTTISGVTLTYTDVEISNATQKIAGSVGGVDLSYERGTITDTFTVDADVSGFNISYKARNSDTATSDRDSLMVSKEINGITLTYAQANTDASETLEGDSWLGDFEGNTSGNMMLNAGDDIQGFGAKMALAGNTVQVKRVNVDSDTTSEDLAITKFYVTRALANGATFEAIYTEEDEDDASSDKKSLDLELAVKF